MNFLKIKLLVWALLGIAINTVPVFAAGPGQNTADELGTFNGKIVHTDGTPFNGFIAFFSSEGLAPMDYGSTRRSPKMVAFTDANGTFTTHMMPAGSYYVGAMERKSWRGGPPKRGEKRYSALDDKGEYLTVTLKGGENKSIGTVKVGLQENFPELEKFFTISGHLLDSRGKGIFDSVVVVKKDYNEAKAAYISDKSSIDGSYQIKLPPGRYFLIARETVTGSTRPKPGSSYGELGQDAPLGVGGKTPTIPTYIEGKAGQVYKNVDITMFKVPIPEVKRKETEAKIKANKMSKESLPDNLPLRKSKTTKAVPSTIKPVEK